MKTALPSFLSPPVVEVVLCVHFHQLSNFSNAHLGLYWNRIRTDFPTPQDAGLLETQVEKFGEEEIRIRIPKLRIAAGQTAARLKMASSDDHRLVQLQNGLLVFNWRHVEGGEEYPRWQMVEREFHKSFSALVDFVKSEGLGDIEPIQWEVTYVNRMYRGKEWEHPNDWQTLFPGIVGSLSSVGAGEFESSNCKLRFVLPNNSGRLHVDLTHGFDGPDRDAKELAVLQFTARGGISKYTEYADLLAGLELGHVAIVNTFADISSKHAREHLWHEESKNT